LKYFAKFQRKVNVKNALTSGQKYLEMLMPIRGEIPNEGTKNTPFPMKIFPFRFSPPAAASDIRMTHFSELIRKCVENQVGMTLIVIIKLKLYILRLNINNIFRLF